jgi:hypothetical protein
MNKIVRAKPAPIRIGASAGPHDCVNYHCP